eukprot:1059372-Pelagomonas_calceolata.AAC.13
MLFRNKSKCFLTFCSAPTLGSHTLLLKHPLFCVPPSGLRDENMHPCKGVRIEDMGHKMGCNGKGTRKNVQPACVTCGNPLPCNPAWWSGSKEKGVDSACSGIPAVCNRRGQWQAVV